MSVFQASYANQMTSRQDISCSHLNSLTATDDKRPADSTRIDIDNGVLRNYAVNGYVTNIQQHRLHDLPDIPGFLQVNPFIKTGYRVYLSRKQCWKSLFVWNNESVNIWSHLLGFIIFFLLMVYDNMDFTQNVYATFSDRLVITAGLLCFQFCMLCSTGYHLFRCESESVDRSWFAFDLTGISIGLLGCYLPGVYFGFYCLSVWRDFYLVIFAFMFVTVLFCQTNPRYYSNAYYWWRVLLYCGLSGYGIIPTFHWIYLNGGFQTEIVQLFAPDVAVVYMFAILAFYFYITRTPEKCCPGHFDYIGSSHQIWHILIVIAFLWWHKCGFDLLMFFKKNSCPVPE